MKNKKEICILHSGVNTETRDTNIEQDVDRLGGDVLTLREMEVSRNY